MYVNLESLVNKFALDEMAVRRAMSKGQLIRGEHFSSENGTTTVFDESKAVERLKELNILKAPDRLA